MFKVEKGIVLIKICLLAILGFSLIISLACQSDSTAITNPTPEQTKPKITIVPEAVKLVDQSRQDLSSRIGVNFNEINVISVKAVDWSDASLGCPEPGKMYAQVITPGFEILLEAKGKSYTYNTSLKGEIIYCDKN